MAAHEAIYAAFASRNERKLVRELIEVRVEHTVVIDISVVVAHNHRAKGFASTCIVGFEGVEERFVELTVGLFNLKDWLVLEVVHVLRAV